MSDAAMADGGAEPLPCLIDVSEEAPYFVAKLALESYRERLIQAFNFIDDTARCVWLFSEGWMGRR